MSENSAELYQLIENEINLGFTYLDTAKIAGSQDHRNQALQNSVKALETAVHFLERVPEDQVPEVWHSRLTELRLHLAKLN